MFIPDLPSLVPLAQWRPRVIFLVQNAEVSQQKPKKKWKLLKSSRIWMLQDEF